MWENHWNYKYFKLFNKKIDKFDIIIKSLKL